MLEPEKKKLRIRESHGCGIHVVGIHEDIVTSAEQVRNLMKSGQRNKHMGLTQLNDCSSRSYTTSRILGDKN